MDKAKVEALFIYDVDLPKPDKPLTDEEIQAEKVIYYYPNETDENVKVSHTSTMEGISSFINNFSKSHLDHIVTNDNLIVLNKWYKDVYVTIIVKNIYKNYKMEALMCRILHSLLNNFISIFTLLHGHIRNFLKYKKHKTLQNINKRKGLQTLLDDYVFTYINTINNENIGIHNELQSFHFFPVEKHTYVTVQNLISTLILSHKQIKNGSLFYEGHLIYSSLPMNDIKTIYNYLVSYNGMVNNLKLNQYPFKKIASSAAMNANGGLSSFARCNSIEEKNAFLLGIKKSSVFMPIITLSGEKKYKLVAYIYKGILLVLLIKGSTIRDEDFDILIDVQNKCTNENSNNMCNLIKLNESLSMQFKKYLNEDDTVKFFYSNNSNNSIKYSFNNKKISNEEFCLIADFHFLLNESEIKYNRIKLNKSTCIKNKEKSNLSNELFNFQQGVKTIAQKNYNQVKNKHEPEYKQASQQLIPSENKGISKNNKKNLHEHSGEDKLHINQDKDEHLQQENTKKKIHSLDEKTTKDDDITSMNMHIDKCTEINEKEQMADKNDYTTFTIEQKKEIVKTNNLVPAEKNKTCADTKVGKKKYKLIYNEELKKKLFDDTSDDVKIEKFFFKEANAPWIFGKKSLQRELFIFSDDSKTSLSKAQQDVNQILDMSFSNIYI
ncbi:conserved Plasmodium protein, unknown function [Plasmodium malariae]|uniref:CCZ1/INTU/HSP4 first Longin domain-containing protein n=1 Tax=Plasmodium malariae TaxID=5858 RepID=A0A1C3KCB4_PLAMA|nr:conserved Plasmodium protein, unknown function [Plasmodium malariae]